MGKPFTWSYSRLNNFETCPKRHYHVDIAKEFREEESEQLKWGNAVHDALDKRISKGVPLPPGMTQYEPWAQRILAGAETKQFRIYTEQKLALTRDFGPTGYFDGNVWFRAKGDVIKVAGSAALAVDWKSGKILEDSVQLALTAACIFAQFPEVQAVRSEFVWLKEGDNVASREDFTRDDMPGLWRNLWPRIEALEQAHNTMTYPPRPGRLCRKYCPVTSCPHHGT